MRNRPRQLDSLQGPARHNGPVLCCEVVQCDALRGSAVEQVFPGCRMLSGMVRSQLRVWLLDPRDLGQCPGPF
jgi:hypothetical protein